jgi:hypothetical protein
VYHIISKEAIGFHHMTPATISIIVKKVMASTKYHLQFHHARTGILPKSM